MQIYEDEEVELGGRISGLRKSTVWCRRSLVSQRYVLGGSVPREGWATAQPKCLQIKIAPYVSPATQKKKKKKEELYNQ